MAFSFPSLTEISRSVLATLTRFPAVILSASMATIAGIIVVSLPESSVGFPVYVAILCVSILGISALIGLDLFTESYSFSPFKQNAVRLLGLLLLGVYIVQVDDRFVEGPAFTYYRFAFFIVVGHLFVACSACIKKGEINAFWEFNKTLFLRAILSALYSAVLYVGLVVALLAIDNLLEIDIDDDRFLQLFFLIAFLFNTFFFLAGVPKVSNPSELQLHYPKGLKVFVQYVLIPLVSVYIIILYVYTGKILVQWELPNGWVSNLVLSFSISGILALLLLFPIKDEKDQAWIRLFSKGYYLALIPLIALLVISIGTRISEYGVTVNRYIVATLGVWLAGLVLYMIFSRLKSIKVIPGSLAIVILCSSFGPLGAIAVSERSQQSRLSNLLAQKESASLTFNQQKEVNSIVDYSLDIHGDSFFQAFFETNIDSLLYADRSLPVNVDLPEIPENSTKAVLMSLFEIPMINAWENETDARFDYKQKVRLNRDWIEIPAGFTLNTSVFRLDNYQPTILVMADELEFSFTKPDSTLELQLRVGGAEEAIALDLASVIPQAAMSKTKNTEVSLPQEALQVQIKLESLELILVIRSMNVSFGEEISHIEFLEAEAFIKLDQ